MKKFITKHVKEAYLGRRRKDLETLKRSLESKEIGPFKRIGHQLKGNASTFGYLDLEEIAIALEVWSECKCWDELRRLVGRLDTWIQLETGRIQQHY